MQLEEAKPSTSTPNSPSPPPPTNSGHKVTAQEIMQSTIPGDNPLEFIQKNLRPESVPQATLEPQPVVASEPTSQTMPLSLEKKDEVPIEAKRDSVPPPETPDGDLEPGAPEQGHFKRLRTALSETKKTLEETKAEAERLKAENEKYKTGEAFPEVLQEKENRIAELSRYEKLVALKSSKAYQDTYIKPAKALREKVIAYGKEYQIPEEVMAQALNLKSERELNGFLEDNFDGVAALEVKQAIRGVQGLNDKAKAAELEPEQELQQIQAQHQQMEEQRKAQLAESVNERARSAWIKALTNIQKEGRITPLLHKENDSQFNENFSGPIRTKAAQEFGRIITALISHGLEDLPEEEATALANYVLHANASAVNFEMGKAALDYATEVEENATRVSQLIRPDIGGSGIGGGGEAAPKAPSSPKEAVQTLLTKHVLAVR